MDFDFRLKAPFCMAISGPSQSGKSTLVAKLIERRLEIIDPPIQEVVYLYTEWQSALFDDLKKRAPGIIFHEGMPEKLHDDDRRHRLYIIDDMMQELASSKEAINLFIRGSHHNNISIIFLIQNFFFKNLRTLTLNCKYIIIMKNVRENGFVSVIGRQMNANKRNNALENAWKTVLKKKYGYLLLDYDANQLDDFRIRDSLFPEEMTVFKSN